MDWNQLLCSRRRKPITAGSSATGGRDLRTEYEKDYQKIIGSASFRRLQDKTQVFPLDKSDFIRTRLTHSLEVSSFARSLGQNIGKNLLAARKDSTFTWRTVEDMCNVLQCAGLIHDIGNPPFGHFGETAIRQWFWERLPEMMFFDRRVDDMLSEQMKQDFYQFEGNAQALRLVSKLHFFSDEYGMNLTYALLSTILKYPISSLETAPGAEDIKYKKMGYFYADREVFQEIQEATGTHGCRNPMTFILEAADDIAYKTADIEDAVKKGCITYGMLERELGRLNKQSPVWVINYFDPLEELRHHYRKALDRDYGNPEFYAVQNWAMNVQSYLIKCATHGFISHYDEIMNGTYGKDLFCGTYAEGLMEAMGSIAYHNAFISEPIYKLELSAGHMLEFLLDKFVKAAIYFDTDKELGTIDEKVVTLISENYVERYYMDSKGKTEEEKLYLRILLVTDLVCGMTDSYAKSLYQELNGII